ncbi:kisspeptin 2 [Osmerus mordax]|uniref:kisspeptin 2 n=1 Tax=Osmerus mordax TaxID=8014 RepID=UPI0035107EEC
MMILALVLFCGIRQHGTLGVSLNGFGTSEWTDTPGLSLPARVRGSSVVTKRELEGLNLPDNQNLGYLLKEKEDERQIICQNRLTRSKFNCNPFGLRFGKRNNGYRSQIGITKTRPNKLSILFNIKELGVPT